MPELDKYLHGIALNEDLAKMMAGDPEPEAPERARAPRQEIGDIERPLTFTERERLRRTINTPGWAVFTRLLERALRRREQAAIVSSQEDPLGNRDKLATDWAYMALWKEQTSAILKMIEAEMLVLQTEEAEKAGKAKGNESVLAE